MKITISLLFIFTVTRVASEAVVTKDVYAGKREDDHGGKPIMAQLQFTNNGHNGHFVLAPGGQQQNYKHPFGLTFAASPHASSHQEQVPYPGVYSYQSRHGPIQYALSQHQSMSHQPPVHMIVTYHPNSPPPHRSIINQVHHAPPPPQSNLNHITIGGPQYHKFSQSPLNSIQHLGPQFLQFPQQPQQQQYQQHQYHIFRPQSHQSAFVPIAVPQQYVQHKPTSGQVFTIVPSPHQGVSPTAAATAVTATASTAHQQQDEPHQQTVGPTAHSTASTFLQPVQHYSSAQPETDHQHLVQPTPSQVYHQHQHQQQQYQQQQPHYSYSIQPSIQVAATKQVAAPIPSSPQQQYKQENNFGSSQYSNEPGIASSYFSMIREYSMTPAKTAVPVHQQHHHVYYPTHSTQVYSTSKPYVMAPIHPTGPGSTADYTSGAGAIQVYQQIGGKASTVSASKYA